jgi:hypothetical protein
MKRRPRPRGSGHLEREAGVAGALQPLAADRDIARIDVDAFDGRAREIAPQRKHFLAGRAAEREDVHRVVGAQRALDEAEYAGIAIRLGDVGGLERFFRRPGAQPQHMAKGGIGRQPPQPADGTERQRSEANNRGFAIGGHAKT